MKKKILSIAILVLLVTIIGYQFSGKSTVNNTSNDHFQNISYERVPDEDFQKEEVLDVNNLKGQELEAYNKWMQQLENNNFQFTDFSKLPSASANFYKHQSKKQNTTYTYANGALIGSWSQKNLTLFDDSGFRANGSAYDPVNKELFVVSSPGHLYKIDESKSVKWITKNEQKNLLGDDFNGINLPDNSFRLLHQKANGAMEFSDDEGVTWVDANGAIFQSGWNYKTLVTKRASGRRIVAHGGSYVTGIATDRVFISTDYGLNYVASNLQFRRSEYTVVLSKPHNSNDVYCFAFKKSNSTISVYKMGENDVDFSLLQNPTRTFVNLTTVHGTKINGTTHFYISGNDSHIYYSNNEGASFTLRSNTNDRALADVHPTKPNVCFKGFIDLYMSSNYGQTFSTNNHYLKSHYVWDLRHMKTYDEEDGSNFTFVGMDFGSFYTHDSSQWNSWTSINAGSPIIMAYDGVTSEKYDRIYVANQDRGSQAFFDTPDTNGIYKADREANTDVLRVSLSRDEESVWFWYYYGTLGRASVRNGKDYRTVKRVDFFGSWWATIMVPSPDMNEDAMIVPAGGTQLNKFTYANNTITKSFLPYTFSSGPVSFTYSELNTNRWYVGLRNGVLMYSSDGGNTYSQSSYSGTLPTEESSLPYRKRRTVIKASRADENTVFYAGKGSNFLMSTDGGATLTKHTTGLSVSRIMDMDTSPDGKFVFAACEFSGAWVFSVEEDKWYQMTGLNVPNVQFTDVQYIVSKNLIRFSTYGSGVVDFKIEGGALSVNEVVLNNNIKIKAYPNPTSGNFEILNLSNIDKVNAKVYSIDGRIISSKEYKVSGEKINLSLNNEAAGVYFVKLNSSNKTLKIIKE